MKIGLRHDSKCIDELKQILIQHINLNLKDYLILSIVFVIGVMIGVIIINNSNEHSKSEISGYINSFVDTIKDEKYEIDKFKLLKISVAENAKMVGIIWLAGSTIIGIPLIYVIIVYKGFSIGYTISAIISSLGIWKRNRIFFSIIIFAKYNCYTYNSYA